MLLILILPVVMLVLIGCGDESGSDPDANPIVEIEIEGHGTIIAELFPEYAPITVENFLNLVDEGFYNGLTFHRIMSGFMIQGGCPYGMGFGGSGANIVGEFPDNGIENPLSHTRGTLSMARSWDYDSASSQFFIMHATYQGLDSGYAAFGRVTSGLDVVDSVVSSVTPLDDNGTIDQREQPVIREIRVVTGS